MDVIEEKVKDILDNSKQKFSSSGVISVVVNNIDDLIKELEIIKRVYNKKPFDAIQYELIWCVNNKNR